MTETQYNTRYLKPLLVSLGYLVHKHSEKFQKGWPDFTAIRNGETIYIESKVRGGKLTDLQLHTLVDIAKAGARAYVFMGAKEKDGKINHMVYQVLNDWTLLPASYTDLL